MKRVGALVVACLIIVIPGFAGVPGTVTARPAAVLPREAPGPAYVFPSNGTVFPLNGTYLFQVQPVSGAIGYLWSFVQGGMIVYQNAAWDGHLSSTTFPVTPQSAVQRHLQLGVLHVWVRAVLANGQMTASSPVSVRLQRKPAPGIQPKVGSSTPGKVLFSADTHGGLDRLAVSDTRKHFNGMLVTDGSTITLLHLPVLLKTPNYAVEAEIQQISPRSHEFGLVARLTSDGQGYIAGYNGYAASLSVGNPMTSGSLIKSASAPTRVGSYDTYRIEVKGNSITSLLDQSPVLQMSNNLYLDPGQAGLIAFSGAQITVRAIRVIAL